MNASGKPANDELPTPFYWMNEVSGHLRAAVGAYLVGDELTADQLAYLLAYLKQWMRYPWQASRTDSLRSDLESVTTSAGITAWLSDAVDAGIDPL